MAAVYILVVIFYIAASARGASLSSRITGVGHATREEYPYQVSLQRYEQHLCGGAILNEGHVITAAHCVQRTPSTLLDVVVGMNTLAEGGLKYNAIRIIIHELYNGKSGDNDIAIIGLLTEIKFGEAVQPIALETGNVDEIPLIFLRWRKNLNSRTNVRSISRDRCETILNDNFSIRTQKLCIFSDLGDNVWYRDSSGLLVTGGKGKLVGIQATTMTGPSNSLYVFTRVSNYVDWINEKISQQDRSVENCIGEDVIETTPPRRITYPTMCPRPFC